MLGSKGGLDVDNLKEVPSKNKRGRARDRAFQMCFKWLYPPSIEVHCVHRRYGPFDEMLCTAAKANANNCFDICLLLRAFFILFSLTLSRSVNHPTNVACLQP